MTDETARTTVYYDGKCPMCSSIIERVRNSNRRDEFVLRDMHRARSLPFDKAAIERAIHLVDREGKVHKGSDAIFKITERYPRLELATRFARFPPVKAFAPAIYAWVAANRRFLAGQASRVLWLKITLTIAFCIGLALSSHLWTGPRSFPTAPVLDALPAIGGGIVYGLFVALFSAALFIGLAPKPQIFIAAFLAIILLFCALDQTRWQPWVFQYSFLLLLLAVFSWRSEDANGVGRTLNIARLVIAGTYIFSGLQKLNWNFIDNDFPWIVQPITKLFPVTAGTLHALGVCAPFIQIAFGAGLLTKRFRRGSLLLAVGMHVFILAMFGPFGHDWNNVVWPWTAAMAVFDIVLFAGAEFSPIDVIWSPGHHVHKLALALFAVLPLLSFFNLWDSYLSAALYSGNLVEATIYLSDAGQRALPVSIAAYAVHTSSNTNVLNIQRWAIDDVNVTPYPETRIYKRIAKSVCQSMSDPSQLVLIVEEKRLFFSQPETGYRCKDM